jgi:hypothetical protein
MLCKRAAAAAAAQWHSQRLSMTISWQTGGFVVQPADALRRQQQQQQQRRWFGHQPYCINWQPAEPVVVQQVGALRNENSSSNETLYITSCCQAHRLQREHISLQPTQEITATAVRYTRPTAAAYPVVCLEVVDLLLEHCLPEVLADELDHLKRVTHARLVTAVPADMIQVSRHAIFVIWSADELYHFQRVTHARLVTTVPVNMIQITKTIIFVIWSADLLYHLQRVNHARLVMAVPADMIQITKHVIFVIWSADLLYHLQLVTHARRVTAVPAKVMRMASDKRLKQVTPDKGLHSAMSQGAAQRENGHGIAC